VCPGTSPYRYAERVFLILTLPFLAYPIAAVLGHPKWSSVAANAVVPHLIADRTFLLLCVALIGTTITPYMQLYQAAAVADRGTQAGDYKAARTDAIVGSIVCNLVSMAIIVAVAAAIGGQGPLTSAAQAATALEPVVGSAAKSLFAVGLLGASALAAAVVPLSTAYALSEAVGAERSISRSFSEAPLFNGLFTGQIVIGAAVALAPGNLISLLINTQIINGLIAPIFLTFLVILASRPSVLGPAVNTPRFRTAAITCVGVVGILAVVAATTTVAGWFS
jgi:Mn2+/Fe2+ NRAMP family transporter